jgi:hypothetical protein
MRSSFSHLVDFSGLLDACLRNTMALRLLLLL